MRVIPNEVPRFFFPAALWRARDAERDLLFTKALGDDGGCAAARCAGVSPESCSSRHVHLDRGTAIFCFGPHERSHRATFAWETTRPARASAIPRRISATCSSSVKYNLRVIPT